jgi:DNA protecting protein DprA
LIRYIIALTFLGLKNENIKELITNYSIYDIANMFISDNENFFADKLDLIKVNQFFTNRNLINEALSKADNVLYQNEKEHIKTTYISSDSYPSNLSKIDNPPAVIYYKGADFTTDFDKAIACVGTRKPTRLSYNAINYLVPQWVNEDVAIISGLACGVDKISQQSCIVAGGKTIAVVAHGLDTVYPKENTYLAEQILNYGGIIMSEYPIGTNADKFRFVNRNRLIVGLSKAVAIFECDIKGGTMHNVEYAEKQKKPIFCPHLENNIVDIQSGTKYLLDSKTAMEMKSGRDYKKIIEVMGYNVRKPLMPTSDIKEKYLKTLIQMVNSPAVIELSLKENNLKLTNINDKNVVYNEAIHYVKNNNISLDRIINTIIKYNIASITNNIIFTD